MSLGYDDFCDRELAAKHKAEDAAHEAEMTEAKARKKAEEKELEDLKERARKLLGSEVEFDMDGEIGGGWELYAITCCREINCRDL